MPQKFIIEGLDFLGKSTLIEGILNRVGYHEVIHYQKPKKLACYNGDYLEYQRASFRTMFQLLNSNANIVMDRGHLGEMVYAPIYRGYDGDYVIELERVYRADMMQDVRLVLLTEDFSVSKHFIDDGESLGGVEKREQEQELFLKAFNQSTFKDKRIVCVTDQGMGGFRPKEQILEEVLWR